MKKTKKYQVISLYPPAICKTPKGWEIISVGSPVIAVSEKVTLKDIEWKLLPGYESIKVNRDPKNIMVWDVPSSKGNNVYTVEKNGTNWTCSCPGFKWNNRCKHVLSKQEELKNEKSLN